MYIGSLTIALRAPEQQVLVPVWYSYEFDVSHLRSNVVFVPFRVERVGPQHESLLLHGTGPESE